MTDTVEQVERPLTSRGAWSHDREYEVNDLVQSGIDSCWYVCTSPGQSVGSDEDLAAGSDLGCGWALHKKRYSLRPLLRFLNGETWEEMADELGLRPDTLRQKHYRGMSVWEADDIAIRAGLEHASVVWPDWLDDIDVDLLPDAIADDVLGGPHYEQPDLFGSLVAGLAQAAA
ncbi:MAG: hypothetical protein AAFZ07_16540 [Actinomycetota bacterium]